MTLLPSLNDQELALLRKIGQDLVQQFTAQNIHIGGRLQELRLIRPNRQINPDSWLITEKGRQVLG